MDAKLLNQPIHIEELKHPLIDVPMKVAKTREEYDQMTKDELVAYSRQFGEKIESCHKSDKNHRYPCSWCKKIPDETRIYVSADRKDARYLCYRCATEEDQLKTWTELKETSYWLPIAPPQTPQFNTGDPDLTCHAEEVPESVKQSLLKIPMPPNAPFRPFGPSLNEEEDGNEQKRKKLKKE